MALQRVHQPGPQKTQTQPNASRFAPRPLTAQAQQDADRLPTQVADSEAPSLEQAARFGHHFVNIPVYPPGMQASVSVQRKQVTDDQPVPDAEQRPNRTGLPDHLKAGIENLSGLALDNVRVHFNSPKPAQLQALAYAQGTEIHVAPGQERHLPHEAWHVVQQAQGRVKPTIQLKGGVPVNDDAGLEREADMMGGKALNLPSIISRVPTSSQTVMPTGVRRNTSPRGSNATIQRLTLLAYNPVHNRPQTDVIAAMHHARVAMTGTETQLASLYSGYQIGAAPGNCKHYVAYNMLKEAVINAITPPARPNLGAAVAWLNGRAMHGAGNFAGPGGNYNLGAQPAPNIPTIAGVLPTHSEATINTEVDDFIKNLANDPRNLYYRANSTGDAGGTQLDVPTGGGARTLAYEVGRLGNYRNYLLGLGLAGI